VDEYGGRQCVGIDLHRRRRVMVRMTPEGERLGTAVRVDSSPFELAEQVGSWGEGLHPLLWSDVTRMTTTRYHPAGDRHEIVVPRVEHAPKPPVAEPAHLADSAVGIDRWTPVARSVPQSPLSSTAGPTAIGRPAEWLAASGGSGHRAGRTIGRTRWSFVPTRAALWLRTLVLSG
jgi:hypothetical protein